MPPVWKGTRFSSLKRGADALHSHSTPIEGLRHETWKQPQLGSSTTLDGVFHVWVGGSHSVLLIPRRD